MFKIEYILELLSGRLTEKGYKSFLSGIASLVRKYRWSKNIIVSEIPNSENWSIEDIKELMQQFFEYAITKNKFAYLEKVPDNYLSYYFTQIFISFVANRISEEQHKQGLSFEKCKELICTITKEKYFSTTISSIDYVSIKPFSENDIQSDFDFETELKYLSPIVIKEDTKHFKPLVAMALEDIFNLIDKPIQLSILIEMVYKLLDQSVFVNPNAQDDYDEQPEYDIDSRKFILPIKEIIKGLSKVDAQIMLEYLFHTQGEISLSSLAEKYDLPQSTAHHKTEQFKKKITQNYIPENEDDGMFFLKNLSTALDDLAK
jgi:hypothetical protein